MNDILGDSVFFGVIISILGYFIGIFVNKKVKLINPLLFAVLFVILILVIFKIDFKSYKKGGDYISFFLTPATVCLAVPLYRERKLLKKYAVSIFSSISIGVVSSFVTLIILKNVFNLGDELYATLMPRNITTAIGMELSKMLGGIEEITVAVIVITGILGNAIGEYIFKMFRIDDAVARGLALGTASHAVGTSKAIELGKTEAAMASLSITVAGLLTVLLAPILI